MRSSGEPTPQRVLDAYEIDKPYSSGYSFTYQAEIHHTWCLDLPPLYEAVGAHEAGEIDLMDPWTFDSDDYPKLYVSGGGGDSTDCMTCGETIQA